MRPSNISPLTLGPCPFCGGDAELIRHTFFRGGDTFGVQCVECKAQTHQFFTDIEEACAAWNIRTFRRADNNERLRID